MKYIIVAILFTINLVATGFPADYYKIKDTKAMKKYFFNFIHKMANQQNKYILEDRKFVQTRFQELNIFKKDTARYKVLKIRKSPIRKEQ